MIDFTKLSDLNEDCLQQLPRGGNYPLFISQLIRSENDAQLILAVVSQNYLEDDFEQMAVEISRLLSEWNFPSAQACERMSVLVEQLCEVGFRWDDDEDLFCHLSWSVYYAFAHRRDECLAESPK
jgi:hypothetical protein